MMYLKIIYNYWLIGNSTQIQNLPKVSILKILVSISWIPILFHENDFYLMFWKSYLTDLVTIFNQLETVFKSSSKHFQIYQKLFWKNGNKKFGNKKFGQCFQNKMNSKSIFKNGNDFQKVWLLFHSIKNLQFWANFGPIWLKISGEVYVRVNES